MEQDYTNWIAERAKCNMAALWADVCNLLVKNVKWMNDESTERGWGIHYSKPSNGTHRTTRYRGQEEEGSCRWRYEDGPARVVFTVKQPDFTACLTTRWDAETSQCQLVVKLSVHQAEVEFLHAELGKAVQYILEPFFFPKEAPTAS